ncbi:hypothetical protein ACQCT5_10305 [Sutcliffiella halmapala]
MKTLQNNESVTKEKYLSLINKMGKIVQLKEMYENRGLGGMTYHLSKVLKQLHIEKEMMKAALAK